MILSDQEWDKAWSVTVIPLPQGCLHLIYPDGEERIFDVWHYLKRKGRTKGFWGELFDQEYFNTVSTIQNNFPEWDDGLIAFPADFLYTHSELVKQ